MRNALLPPVSSQLYNFGNINEVQMPNLEVDMPMNGKVNRDIHGASFYMQSKFLNDGNQLMMGGGFTIPHQPLINYQPAGYQFTSSVSYIDIPQQSMLPSFKVSAPRVEMDLQAMQSRKRSGEVASLVTRSGFSDLIQTKTTLSGWNKNKRKKVASSEEQWRFQPKQPISLHDPKLQVPVKRNQKLSDKITALQKLVSPYGKTDTASVLQEASLYIKLLQEQIQNLFQMLSSSHKSEIEGRRLDLRSKGLCLVPVSVTEKVAAQENHVDSNGYSEKK